MNTKIEIDEESEIDESGSLLSTVRKVVLAGVGAITSAQESAETQVGSFVKDVEIFVNKLVERGEIADKEGRELIGEVVEKRKKAAGEASEKLSQRVDSAETIVSKRVDKVINRFNVPTQSDLNIVTEKIALLSEKVDKLQAAQKEAVTKQNEAVAAAANYKKEATTAKRKATIAEKATTAANDKVASLQKALDAANKACDALNKKVAQLEKERVATPVEAAPEPMATSNGLVQPQELKDQVASSNPTQASN